MHCLLVLVIIIWLTPLGAAERSVALQAPLTTVVAVEHELPERIAALHVVLTVPDDAPADLGIGAFVTDDDGEWYQSLHPQVLSPGRHELRFATNSTANLHGAGHSGRWSSYRTTRTHRAGLVLWSASTSTAAITIHQLEAIADTSSAPSAAKPGLFDLRHHGATLSNDLLHIATGQRYQLSVRPDPFPVDPFKPERFALDLVISGPNTDLRIPGFYHQAVTLIDRGDYEQGIAESAAGFSVRWRPQFPGRYQLQLEARWGADHSISTALPDLDVSGAAWDDFVRVDPNDPRFFATGVATETSQFYWATAINARSVWDLRGAQRTASRLSPDRRWHAYEAYLDRWQAAGLGAAEVWMSSWNLALEWRDDWPDFPGLGRYSQINAERLDRLLDAAYARGIRINLVINNHGQASGKTDAEWRDNPYNAEIRAGTPGPVAQAQDFFTSPEALAGQEQLRRYLVARYADHPAILGWKLWTEMNLTAGRKEDLRTWHEQATQRWHALDAYGHPVTSHWSGNYRTPDRQIVAQNGIDYVCIDAYHGRRANRPGILLPDLFWHGLHHVNDNLSTYSKPVVITEYGGSSQACPEPQLIAEHHAGPWAALMAGYAVGPMLWWIEWVDQGEHYAPYTAISRFIAGEDMRSHPDAPSGGVELSATGATELWCRAWNRPGRILGYLLDPVWGYEGLIAEEHSAATIRIGSDVRAGPMALEWWDADTGTVLKHLDLKHPGGELTLTAPSFQRHIAFKLWRAGNN
ncbi:MAG: hypothetical protein PF961_23035 [Planctomycetota bacterium]|jgi:hypothetical protein|nr:hypothetical protein [Planctomycetota bacterium]